MLLEVGRITQPIRALNERILSIFVVDPSSGRTLGYVDGLRAVAVSLVVALHCWGWAPARLVLALPILPTLDFTPIVSHGGYGVQLFFVLSGFLLAQPFLKAVYLGRPQPSLRTYFKLRLFRIVPAYYVCIFLMLLFFVPRYIPPSFLYSRAGLFTLIAHLFFVQFIFPISSTSFNLDSPLWTLTMEMIFYIALPWTARLFVHKRWMVAVPMAAVISLGWLHACRTILQPLVYSVRQSALSNPTVGPNFDVITANRFLLWQFPAQAVVFALGIAVANLYVWHSLTRTHGSLLSVLTSTWAGVTYFVAGCALVLLTEYPGNPLFVALGGNGLSEDGGPSPTLGYYLTKPLLGIGLGLVVAGISLGTSWLKAIFSFTPLRLIGIISFSIYLWHALIIRLFLDYPEITRKPTNAYFWTLLGAAALAVFALACFMYFAVERPFMRYARRSVRRTAPVSDAIEVVDVSTLPTAKLPAVVSLATRSSGV
jgi:peptidoglycan/LPS O-acetylase OafA/YrhL